MTTPQETPIRVLFLCIANSARSQIAEALLARRAGDRFIVASAGTQPAPAIHPETMAALEKVGIDWTGRHPKGVEAVGDVRWDFIITTCDQPQETCATFPGQPIYARWSVPDPAALPADRRPQAFRETVQLLSWRIDLMLALRPQVLSRAAAEQRLRSIGIDTPPDDLGRPGGNA